MQLKRTNKQVLLQVRRLPAGTVTSILEYRQVLPHDTYQKEACEIATWLRGDQIDPKTFKLSDQVSSSSWQGFRVGGHVPVWYEVSVEWLVQDSLLQEQWDAGTLARG